MRSVVVGAGTRVEDAWLPAVLPATARRFDCQDAGIGATLATAGAHLIGDGADVQIAPLKGLDAAAQYVAQYVVVTIDPDAGWHDSPSIGLRATRRVAAHLAARAQVVSAARAVRRRGYQALPTVWWDKGQSLRLPGLAAAPLRFREHLPRRAVVAATRGAPARTVLDEVLAQCRRMTGRPVRLTRLLARSGQLVGLTDSDVLRVALGPGREWLQAHRRALEQLRAGTLAADVERRSPRVLGHGRVGLAQWLLEDRLAGTALGGPPEGAILDDCLEFLVKLHAAGPTFSRPPDLLDAADVIAQFGDPSTSAVLRSLAREVDSQLAGAPRGFGHGDFFHGNLLAGGDRLLGVIDWTSAGPGRLPLLDWLHLRLRVERGRGSQGWGPAIINQLLPWAQRGGDALTDQYCARIGLDGHRSLLRGFVAAYWLDRLSQQLAGYGGDRMQRPVWLRNNLHRVLDAFTGSARA